MSELFSAIIGAIVGGVITAIIASRQDNESRRRDAAILLRQVAENVARFRDAFVDRVNAQKREGSLVPNPAVLMARDTHGNVFPVGPGVWGDQGARDRYAQKLAEKQSRHDQAYYHLIGTISQERMFRAMLLADRFSLALMFRERAAKVNALIQQLHDIPPATSGEELDTKVREIITELPSLHANTIDDLWNRIHDATL